MLALIGYVLRKAIERHLFGLKDFEYSEDFLDFNAYLSSRLIRTGAGTGECLVECHHLSLLICLRFRKSHCHHLRFAANR